MAPVWAQRDEGTITPEETMIIFAIFIVAVISLFLYLARHSIRRQRTEYDDSNYDSKKNRDYEKYHSDWQDDYQEYGGHKGAPDEPDYYGILGSAARRHPACLSSPDIARWQRRCIRT